MRVRCKSNSGRGLVSSLINPEVGLTQQTDFYLTVGKSYIVYGMTEYLGHVWYYVLDDAVSDYPVWKPACLFDIEDPKLSAFWQLGFHSLDGKNHMVIAFKEWVEIPCFYDDLTDGKKEAVQTFLKYKPLIDKENLQVRESVHS
jgi:hypothetical protein